MGEVHVYRSLAKERPWAEHLTSLPIKGVGAVLSVFIIIITMKERPCYIYNDSMPLKRITGQLIMQGKTTSSFKVES